MICLTTALDTHEAPTLVIRRMGEGNWAWLIDSIIIIPTNLFKNT